MCGKDKKVWYGHCTSHMVGAGWDIPDVCKPRYEFHIYQGRRRATDTFTLCVTCCKARDRVSFRNTSRTGRWSRHQPHSPRKWPLVVPLASRHAAAAGAGSGHRRHRWRPSRRGRAGPWCAGSSHLKPSVEPLACRQAAGAGLQK